MAYKHGTYGQFDKTIGTTPTQSGTTAVYIGVAPVNLVKGCGDVVNIPVKISNMTGAQQTFGYSNDWKKFSLCEAMVVHFENLVQNVGPVVFINVLNPAKHKSSESVTTSLSFINGRATIVSDTIIMDSLVLAEKVEGVDYETDYDFTKGTVSIESVGIEIKGSVQATYDTIDVTQIISADIIGGVTAGGEYTGMGCIDLVYPELGLITNIIAAPGYSHLPEVYKKMVVSSQKINGHWDAFVNVDIPIEEVETIAAAIKWKGDNGYNSERVKVYYPKWKLKDGTIFHLSTIATWLMLAVDGTHNGIPMESPSNKQIPSGKQYFGENSTNRGFDQQLGNSLNEKGITTAVFWGGMDVLWGPHTAAYAYGLVTDKRVIFDNSIRMMEYVSNSFQQEYAITIDGPMTRAMADTIKNREQEKADALVAIGALIGSPEVSFNETDNSADEVADGNFVWSNKNTPTPPFKSGTLKVAYTDAGFATFFEGGE